MLHRLFSTKGAPGVNAEDDHRTHHLLYGAQACTARQTCRAQNESRVQEAFAEAHTSPADIRVVIAQDLGDKAKVVLFDSQRPRSQAHAQTQTEDLGATPKQQQRRRHDADATPTASDKRGAQSPSADMLAELMFGTAPLSFRGTSVRVHPLSNADPNQEGRQFLFTKAFSVDILADGIDTPATATSSGCNSLSSSYSNGSVMQEFPFPRLTPISSTAPSPAPKESRRSAAASATAMTTTTTSPRAASHLPQHSIQHHAGSLFGAHSHASSVLSASHGHSHGHGSQHQSQSRHAQFAGLPDPAVLTPFEGPIRHSGASIRSLGMTPLSHQRKTSRHHARVPSQEDRSAPHVPFVPEASEHADYFSGWLPSPEPKFGSRRRTSLDTNRSSPTAGVGGGHGSRYQSTMIAIGIIFTVPGSGLENHECAVMTRYWQMASRAAFALQRQVHNEVEPALAFVANQGVLPTPRSLKARPVKGEAQVYQRGKKYYVALAHHALANSRNLSQAVHDFQERLIGAITLPAIRHLPLTTEAELLADEITHLMQVLDRKERNYMLSTTISYLASHRELLQSSSDCPQSRNSLSARIVVVSDDAVLARRFIYCLARLFFRHHNEHIRTAKDYAMVWPAGGIMGQDRRDILRRRESSLHMLKRSVSGWDIPAGKAAQLQRPVRSDSHEQLPSIQSPSSSIYLRPPSSTSTSSSRASSWRPSWSWFGGPNGGQYRSDDLRGRRSLDGGGGSIQSETRTLQTSWTSSDFNDIPLRSPSKSPLDGSASASSDVEEEDDLATPPDEVKAAKRADGRVTVELLPTAPLLALTPAPSSRRKSSILSHRPSLLRQSSSCETDGANEIEIGVTSAKTPSAMLNHASAFHEFPLTGYLTRFHPDMLLQGVPATGFDEARVREYLREEELHVHRSSASPADSGAGVVERNVSLLLIELGCRNGSEQKSSATGGWRLRRISRRPSRPQTPSTPNSAAVERQQQLARVAATALYGEAISDLDAGRLPRTASTATVSSSSTAFHVTGSGAGTGGSGGVGSKIAAPIPTRAVAFADLAQPPSISSSVASADIAGSSTLLAPPPRLPLHAILQANSPANLSVAVSDLSRSSHSRSRGSGSGSGSEDDGDDGDGTGAGGAWEEEIVGGFDEHLLAKVHDRLARYRRGKDICHVKELVDLFD